jgi:glycosyltransferase involved in cell wall biosynthesis
METVRPDPVVVCRLGIQHNDIVRTRFEGRMRRFVAKVTIIIPCWNAGSDMAGTAASALAQANVDIEVVIVDDGSTDPATLRVLDSIQDPRVRVFHQSNAGPAAARNRAIAEATGEYILPLDADDLLEPGYAAKAVAVLDVQPDVGIVYCRAEKFGAEEGPWDLPAFSADELALGNVIFVSAMFRRSDWEMAGGFDEGLRHGMEDYDFWIRLVHAGRKVVMLGETLFRCRVREGSRTALFEQDREQVVATYARIFRKNRDFFAEHAEALFRRHFVLLNEMAALRERLAEESKSAAAERASLVGSKVEADRYNMALRSDLERKQSELAQAHMRIDAWERRFRLLKPLWPGDTPPNQT